MTCPLENGYAIFAGLERLVDYLNNLTFSDSDIDYLREIGGYPEAFLDYLKEFKFACTVRSALEGDLVFNNEPIIQVEGPLAQAQLIETALLNMVNFQTLIATKAARIKSVIGDDPLLEFRVSSCVRTGRSDLGNSCGLYRRCGCHKNNVRAGKIFGIPASGTHAHSLVQSYGNDYDAFMAYAKTHKDCVF